MQDKTLESITITRTGQPPLKFNGVRIGSGSTEIYQGQRANRWTTVDIYWTQGGRFVVDVTNHTIWQGEHDYTKASSFATPTEVIDYLMDVEGNLGRASQEALEEAAKANAEFSEAYAESVD